MKDVGDTLTAQELTDLRDLIASPGWRLVETMVDREWGAVGFGEKIARTIGGMSEEAGGIATQQLLQAVCTQREVLRVMKWPREQVLKATHQARGQMASMNRGGL